MKQPMHGEMTTAGFGHPDVSWDNAVVVQGAAPEPRGETLGEDCPEDQNGGIWWDAYEWKLMVTKTRSGSPMISA